MARFSARGGVPQLCFLHAPLLRPFMLAPAPVAALCAQRRGYRVLTVVSAPFAAFVARYHNANGHTHYCGCLSDVRA